jgi:hypothetical protein
LRAIVRPPEAIASLFARPAASLARWDAALRERAVFAVAGVDAHARIGQDDYQGRPTGWSLGVPTYAQMFRTVSQLVQLDAPLTGDAARDAAAVVEAIRRGRTYSAVRAIAEPAVMEFFAEQDGRRIEPGGALQAGRSAIFQVRVEAVPGAWIILVGDGQPLVTGRQSLITQRPVTAQAYRAEIFFPGRRVPWIVTNAIRTPPAPRAENPAAPIELATSLADPSGWAVEHDAASSASVRPEDGDLRFDVGLGGGTAAGQFGAAVVPLPAAAAMARVGFTIRASAPTRVSVQARQVQGRDGLRWRRSVYADTTPRTYVLALADFDAIGHETPIATIVEQGRVDALLFVVDTLNTASGVRTTVWIRDVRIGR